MPHAQASLPRNAERSERATPFGADVGTVSFEWSESGRDSRQDAAGLQVLSDLVH
jgi:hypothetical protein